MMFPSNFDLHMDRSEDVTTEQPNGDETDIQLSCRYVCLGSYSYKPRNKVRISSDGVTILAPSLRRRGSEDVMISIPLKSVVHVLTNADARPTVLLYTEAKTGEYVRKALDMHRDSGVYFDPTASIEEQKRITLIPRSLPRRAVMALRSLFGMVLDDLDAAGARRAQGSLSSPSEHESEPSDADRPPSAADAPPRALGDSQGSGSPDVKDNVSSSSSIIFPPSPTPISLSSHSSSLHSPKSSHSSKKRKNRHKKNKTNKKMKYVLVKNPEPHPVDAFLSGVAPILKSLNPVFLNLAKSEIISAALKYERKMLTDNCNGISEK